MESIQDPIAFTWDMLSFVHVTDFAAIHWVCVLLSVIENDQVLKTGISICEWVQTLWSTESWSLQVFLSASWRTFGALLRMGTTTISLAMSLVEEIVTSMKYQRTNCTAEELEWKQKTMEEEATCTEKQGASSGGETDASLSVYSFEMSFACTLQMPISLSCLHRQQSMSGRVWHKLCITDWSVMRW
jgi:hypothetical protein